MFDSDQEDMHGEVLATRTPDAEVLTPEEVFDLGGVNGRDIHVIVYPVGRRQTPKPLVVEAVNSVREDSPLAAWEGEE